MHSSLRLMVRADIVAALGPTNTGKTHRALIRMLEHESGMMGLPLRLLAREVYDRVTALVGESQVALITGEEKRVPHRPRYFICTVEAMPLDREVDFVAIDEIQLAAHPERGHVFTDRLLRARGLRETWFLGSDTVLPLLQNLVPSARVERFPRYSELRHEGNYSLGTIPKRTAVVAFSVERVYQLAEKLRARKGGAAVVLGALSPRARNAQVALYQAGEVDYLVATDAIGMGLNLDIDHVAFADTRKFDGYRTRDLETQELSQIAGRAGRYQTDGGFGTFERQPFAVPIARAIEQHRFPFMYSAEWRNHDLDFSSPGALVASLEVQPTVHCLRLIASPIDAVTLKRLLQREDIRSRVTSSLSLELLWETCKIPDYRKLLVEEHANLVAEIFLELEREGVLRTQPFESRLERLAQHSGDIDAITARIASVRTWTYVACKASWTESGQDLEARTRALEDELSDALHAALVERFVERRNRVHHMPALQKDRHRSHNESWQETLARLKSTIADASDANPNERTARLVEAKHEDVRLSLDGMIHFEDHPVAVLRAGRAILDPEVALVQFEGNGGLRDQVTRRLRAFAKDIVSDAVGPLAVAHDQHESSLVRGVLYQLRSGLGVVAAKEVASLREGLTPEEELYLSRQGVVFGKEKTFTLPLLRRREMLARAALIRVHLSHPSRRRALPSEDQSSPLFLETAAARPSFSSAGLSSAHWSMLGYVRVKNWALRVDLYERILALRDTVSPQELQRIASCTIALKSRKTRELLRHIP